MKSPLVLLCGLVLLAPAFAQSRDTEATAITPQTPVASIQYRYSPNAQPIGDGTYRAEVRRRDIATGHDDIAWSSVPYATMTDAMREACIKIQNIYDPNRFCPPAQQQRSIATPSSANTKKVTSAPHAGTLVAKKATDPEPQAKRTMARRPASSVVSGYEIPGCTFYDLVGARVVQRCPSAGTSGTRPYWYNNDAFEGGYGGGVN
jgi:hypothetical protein